MCSFKKTICFTLFTLYVWGELYSAEDFYIVLLNCSSFINVVQCTTQALVFVHVHAEYIQKIPSKVFWHRKKLDASLQWKSIAQQTIVFIKKIFLNRNENKFYSVDLLKVCRTISHVEKLKPIKSEISHHASNYSNHINHLMTWP